MVQFGIKKVIAGESETFQGARDFMEAHGVEVVDLNLEECKLLMRRFQTEYSDLWQEDIGT